MMEVGWYRIVSCTFKRAENTISPFLPNTLNHSLSSCSASPTLKKNMQIYGCASHISSP